MILLTILFVCDQYEYYITDYFNCFVINMNIILLTILFVCDQYEYYITDYFICL